jgi:hypothetical protein
MKDEFVPTYGVVTETPIGFSIIIHFSEARTDGVAATWRV